MQHKTNYFAKAIYLGALLIFGCSSSGAMGCGSSDGGLTVDSQALGVYQIDSYRGSRDGCDQPTDIEPTPSFLVLYSFVSIEDPDDPVLAGVFCDSIDNCRQAASESPEPAIGYSFTAGRDETGWRGWAIQSGGAANDQCRADVQVHTLTSPGPQKINIETQTFVTMFEPTFDGDIATCSNAAAIDALDDNLPCAEIIILDATFAAGL